MTIPSGSAAPTSSAISDPRAKDRPQITSPNLPLRRDFATCGPRLNHEAGGRPDEETAICAFCVVVAGHCNSGSGGCRKLSARQAILLLRFEVRLRLRKDVEEAA